MKEFLFEDKTEDLVKLIGFSPIKKCQIVINAELAMTSSRFYPRRPITNNKVRDELLREIFLKNVRRVL